MFDAGKVTNQCIIWIRKFFEENGEDCNAVEAITKSMAFLPEITTQAKINLPARVRMITLYAVSQSMNGRVANTCNLSED